MQFMRRVESQAHLMRKEESLFSADNNNNLVVVVNRKRLIKRHIRHSRSCLQAVKDDVVFTSRLVKGFLSLCVISDTYTPSSPQILRNMSTLISEDINFFFPVRMISQML